MADVILMCDPKVYAVPIAECGETLVDVREYPDLLRDPRRANPSARIYAHLRTSVLERLLTAESLLPSGLRFVFVEGYRPPAAQRRIFDDYSTELCRANPDWTEVQVRAAASRHISPPDNAPHCAGAAVDLTLATTDGGEVDMGCELNATPEESHNACYTDATSISAEAAVNRKVLADALTAVGLINYPTEWWHWSYGDRYWALLTGAPAAVYGPRDLNGVASNSP
ncbi:MAG: M15 family metallopeptidase [Actinoallomurus sp.]